MKYPAALAYINSFISYAGAGKGRDFPRRMKKLGRMQELLKAHDNPESYIPTILITGTKGKGTTAALLSSILKQAGYRVGTYSSPHLATVRERICLNGRMISKADFVKTLNQLKPYLEQFEDRESVYTPSYFEIMTAMAWLYFNNKTVDIAVMEVGLGGKYDATNCSNPLLAVITSISLEHTEYLGNTIKAITREKTGIMRPAIPVISAACHPDALAAIKAKARRLQCPLLQLDKNLIIEEQTSDAIAVHADSDRIPDIRIPFAGNHQRNNCAAAVGAACFLNRHNILSITERAIRTGIAKAELTGRIDILPGKPPVIIDTAHTAESTAALSAALHKRYPDKQIYALFNLSTDKDLKRIVREFPAAIRKVITVATGHPRNYDPKDLRDRLKAFGLTAVTAPDFETAYKRACTAAGSRGIVVIFGTFFLAGLAYQHIKGIQGE